MIIFCSFFLLLQAFIIYCCITLGKYHSEMDGSEMDEYEDAAQDEYLKEWNKLHKKSN